MSVFFSQKPPHTQRGVSGSVPCSVREECKGSKHIHSPRPHRWSSPRWHQRNYQDLGPFGRSVFFFQDKESVPKTKKEGKRGGGTPGEEHFYFIESTFRIQGENPGYKIIQPLGDFSGTRHFWSCNPSKNGTFWGLSPFLVPLFHEVPTGWFVIGWLSSLNLGGWRPQEGTKTLYYRKDDIPPNKVGPYQF